MYSNESEKIAAYAILEFWSHVHQISWFIVNLFECLDKYQMVRKYNEWHRVKSPHNRNKTNEKSTEMNEFEAKPNKTRYWKRWPINKNKRWPKWTKTVLHYIWSSFALMFHQVAVAGSLTNLNANNLRFVLVPVCHSKWVFRLFTNGTATRKPNVKRSIVIGRNYYEWSVDVRRCEVMYAPVKRCIKHCIILSFLMQLQGTHRKRNGLLIDSLHLHL